MLRVESLLRKYKVSLDFGILSVDAEGQGAFVVKEVRFFCFGFYTV